jgi:hypothetical protein
MGGIIKRSVFWDMMLYSQLKANRRFGGTVTSTIISACVCYLLHVVFLIDTLFDPEGGKRRLTSNGLISINYMNQNIIYN